MATGPSALGVSSRHSSPATAAVVSLTLTFLVAVAVGVAATVTQVLALDERRTEVMAARADPVTVAGPAAGAFRRFGALLDDESRFALVFGPDLDRNQRGTYRLVAGYSLYPAIRVTPAEADAVMVFGRPSADVRRTFEQVAVVDGVWLGRRT